MCVDAIRQGMSREVVRAMFVLSPLPEIIAVLFLQHPGRLLGQIASRFQGIVLFQGWPGECPFPDEG